MTGYLVLIISSIIALSGAALNTTHEEKGTPRRLMKKPNAAGWTVITLLVASFFAQWMVKRGEASSREKADLVARTQRTVDSANISNLLRRSAADSQSFERQLALADSTYRQQVGILTNTASLIGQSKRITDDMSESFATSYQQFATVIAQSTSLLNPLMPMVARFRLRVPLTNDWLRPYLKRTIPVRDSLVRTKLVVDEGGLDHISMDFDKYYKGGHAPDSVLFSFTVDSGSVFAIQRSLDEVSARFLDPGFDIYVFAAPPPFEYYNSRSLLALEATTLAKYPGPTNPFGPKTMLVDYRGGYLILDIFYQVQSIPVEASIHGINELAGKYVLISSQMPNLAYRIESLALYTGQGYSRVTTIPFRPVSDISTQENGTRKAYSTLTYLQKVDSAWVK